MVAHDGQCRKGAGEPYFTHVERVADSVWGWRRKTIAYLHDVIEDQPTEEESKRMEEALRVLFPSDIIDDVCVLSRLKIGGKKPTYSDYILKMVEWNSLDVFVVKLADLDHNLEDIQDIPGGQSLVSRYRKAQGTLEEAKLAKERA